MVLEGYEISEFNLNASLVLLGTTIHLVLEPFGVFIVLFDAENNPFLEEKWLMNNTTEGLLVVLLK
jgi:hypothetical protein